MVVLVCGKALMSAALAIADVVVVALHEILKPKEGFVIKEMA